MPSKKTPIYPTEPKKPPKAIATVATFMADLEHPLQDEIEVLRQIVLDAHEGITEQVKWNAPSFCYDGDDRVTFRLQPTSLQLIFHRGAKVKPADGFNFVDDSGLLKFATPDRGIATFTDMDSIEENKEALSALVSKWIEATTEPTSE